jgi:hypothetical protein
MQKRSWRALILSALTAFALLGVTASSASAWTDIDDEKVIVDQTFSRTYQFSAWIQPQNWTNPRGDWDSEILFTQYAYALYSGGGSVVPVCVVAHIDDINDTRLAPVCGNNGASIGLRAFDYHNKWYFAYNNSGAAHTITGGWVACKYPNTPC